MTILIKFEIRLKLINSKIPEKDFYLNDALTVSKELLGMLLVRKTGKKFAAVRIVETEAYIGEHDPACHAFGKVTNRNSVMFGQEGRAYVYFIYGYYYCFNAVCGKEGVGNAVLIRAGEPEQGIDIMRFNRPDVKNDIELTNGPSKLCMALNIDKTLNGSDITDPESKVFITGNSGTDDFDINISRRIGLNKGIEFPYRFFIKDNPYVTKHKFNKEIINN